MIDSHCHLELLKNIDEKVQNAKNGGLKAVFTAASNFNSNEKIINLSNKYKNYVFPIIGLDPTFCVKDSEKIKKIPFDKGIAIGEIGLDYYWFKEKQQREQQKKLFNFQLELAEKLKKPVVIHTRDAGSEYLDILEKYNLSTIIHCFSGTKEELQRALDNDYWISFATNCCFKKELQSLIKACPLSKILVETDSPYLHPTRKGRNEPANVAEAVKLIANLKNKKIEEVDEQTERNTLNAFNLVI